MARIHPMAFVDPEARLGADVEIGPFCHVAGGVTLGDGCRLIGHCTLLGPAEFGTGNLFYPGCVLGAAPQDLKYKGGPTRLIAGRDNHFREGVTVHRGTEVDAGVTRIGDRNLLMVGVHIAHDVVVENNVIIANNVLIAGHCHIQSYVNIGGASAAHHFTTIGRYAYVAGLTRMPYDVAPYMKASGYEPAVRAVNAEGMKRWGLEGSIPAMKEAFRLIFARRSEDSVGRTRHALDEIERNGIAADEHVNYLVTFIRRQLECGHFGRQLESRRKDSHRDRESFYKRDPEAGN